MEKHSSLRKKRRLKELGSGNRAASPAEVPGPENGSISRAGELRLSEGVAPSQPVELSSPPHAGSQTAPTGVLTDSGFTNRSGTALGRKTPSNERAIVSSQQGEAANPTFVRALLSSMTSRQHQGFKKAKRYSK